MNKKIKDFGLPWIVHLVLHIFLVPGWILGSLVRLKRGKLLWAVVYFLTGGLFGIGLIIDIVTLILSKDYTFLA